MRLTKRARRRLLFVIAFVVVGTAAAIAFSMVQGMQRQRMHALHRADGLKAFAEGDMDAALTHLSVAVQYDQEDVDVILAFAEARSRVPLPNRAHLVESRAYYEFALKLLQSGEPSDAVKQEQTRTLTKLLDLHGQLGELFEMERVADRLLAEDADNIEALTAKAGVCMRSRRFEEAEPIAERLAAIEPGALRWRHLQLQVARSMRAVDAELFAMCDEWIDAWTGDGRMHLLKAAWLFELGYIDPAQQEIAMAVAQGAGSLEVLQQTLGLLGTLDRHDLIVNLIDNTRQDYPNAAWARHAIVEYDWQTGRTDEALREIEQARTDLGELPVELRRDHVMALLSANRLDEARSALQSYVESVNAGDVTQRDRALVIALTERLANPPAPWPSMLAKFDAALTMAPDEPVIHYLRGEVCAKVGEHALAAAAFGKAAAIKPAWVAAAVAQADALLASGRAEQAFDISRAAVRRSPSSSFGPLLTLARSALLINEARSEAADPGDVFESEHEFMQSGARAAAARIDLVGMLKAMHEQMPGHVGVFSLLIQAQMQKGLTDDAERTLRAWMEQPELSVDQLVAATELVGRHNLSVTPSLLRSLHEYRGEDARVPMAHAWMLLRKGDSAAGMEVMDRFFERASNEATASDAVQLQRVMFACEADPEQGMTMARELSLRFPASVQVQTFALRQQPLWEDRALIERIIEQLASALGERSQQVRLARASALLRYQSSLEADRAKAIVIVQSVLEETPTSLIALSLLADAYLKGDRPMHEQAVDALQSAIDAHPREASLYPRLIALLQQLGKYDLAQRYLAQLGMLQSRDPGVARAEVELLLTQGQFEAALLRAMRFIDAQSPPPDRLLLAAMMDRTGRFEEARNLYEQLIATVEGDAARQARAQAAEFFARQGEFARGLDVLDAALEAATEPGAREVMLGWFCARHGQHEQAKEYFSQAVAAAPSSPDAWHALARFHLSRGGFAQAADSAEAGMKSAGNDERLRADLELARAGMSGLPWRESLGRVGQQSSDIKALLVMLELANEVTSRGKEAAPTDAQLDRARAITERHPRFMPGWYLAIALNAAADRLATAADLARTAMTRFPTRPEPAEWATRLFMQHERWNDALSAAEEWGVRLPGQSVAAQCAIATCLIKLERSASGVERLRPHMQQILAQRNDRPADAMVLVDTFLAAGEAGTLIEQSDAMLRERVWRMRWAFASRSTDIETAERVLHELELRASTNEGPAEHVGTIEEHLGLAAEWQQLASRTRRTEHFMRAQSLAERVQEEAETPAMQAAAEFVLATIDESRGETSSAAERYRKVLRSQPEHALALNNLAYLMHSQQGQADEALQLARRAAELLPSSADVLDTLGVVLLATGQPSEAETQLRKALSARPADVNIGLNLVDAMVHQQRFDEASKQLEQTRRMLRRLPDRGVEYEDRVTELQRRIRERVTLAEPS